MMSIFMPTVGPAHRLLVVCLDEGIFQVGVFLVNEIASFRQEIATRTAAEQDLRERGSEMLDARNTLVRAALQGLVNEDVLLEAEVETEEQALATMAAQTRADRRRIVTLQTLLGCLSKGRYGVVLRHFNAQLARMDAMGKLLSESLPPGTIAPSTRERVAGRRRQLLECTRALQAKLTS